VVGIFGLTGTARARSWASSRASTIRRRAAFCPTEGPADLDLDAYRRQIGIVYQESFLFSNTVAANIAFGHPMATMEQIERAARIAAATSSSSRCRTVMRPCWANPAWTCPADSVSAWPRRALLLQPPILILDDPTASVDAARKTKSSAPCGRPWLAAPLLWFRAAEPAAPGDLVLVLENGRLTQTGTPRELIHKPGPYHEPRCCR